MASDHVEDAAPKHWARIFAIVCLAVLLFIGAIAGAYALSIHETGAQNASRAAAAAKRNANEKALAAKTQILSSVPLCKGLIMMDDAKNGATNASKRADSYGHRLARAITVVVDDSGCRLLIKDVNNHVPFPQITKDLAKAQKKAETQ